MASGAGNEGLEQRPTTAARGAGRWRTEGNGRSLLACDLQGFKHGFGMTGDFHPAPLLGDAAVGGDQEGAADHAQHLAPVHVLFVDHVEGPAQRFVAIADQRKLEPLFGAEVVVRFHRVAGNAQHRCIQFPEFRQQRVEVDAFGGAAGGAVLRVEVEHHFAALEGRQAEVGVAGGGKAEVGRCLVEHDVSGFGWVRRQPNPKRAGLTIGPA